MAIEVIGTIKPKNNGNFPIVEAKDVLVNATGKRLDEALLNMGTSGVPAASAIPVFDLTALGLGNVALDGEEVSVETDTSAIMAALENGSVKFSFQVGFGEEVGQLSFIPTSCSVQGAMYLCNAAVDFDGKILVSIAVLEGAVAVWISALEGASDTEITSFDLAALGLRSIRLDGSEAILQTDTTAIIAALEKGPVRFSFNLASLVGGEDTPLTIMPNAVGGGGQWMCTAVFDLGEKLLATIHIGEGILAAWVSDFKESVATNIDMSTFDTNGKITETYSDGSTKTTTIEFDENGQPIKITDGNGNVTALTW